MNGRLFTVTFLTLLIQSKCAPCFSYEQALVVQPIIDLVGISFCKEYGIKNSVSHYQHIPLCAKSGRYACPRLLQLLYNEQVTIVETHEDEVRIEVSHLFFQRQNDDTQHIGYWTHKRNVVPLDVIKKKGVDLHTVPKPISFLRQRTQPSQELVTLLHPYFDPATQRTYSAGTRFVRAHTNWIAKNHVGVYVLEPHTLTQTVIGIPKRDTLLQQPKSLYEQQQLFVSLLKEWANTQAGFFPYTWGGCSIAQSCDGTQFALKSRKNPYGICEYYQWPSLHGQPFSGCDCAGLIARAAQIAGMPYYFKNTTTLARNLRPLKEEESIENGDLIWFSGHVLVVSDTKHHKAIEARGYDHGFGKIQELSLAQLFEGICTYDQLAQAFFNHAPLKRLNAQGTVVQTVPQFKIFKMSSLGQEE